MKGDYFAAADFRAEPMALPTLAAGRLSGLDSEEKYLPVARASLFQFNLDVTAGPGKVKGDVELLIRDGAGEPVMRVSTAGGSRAESVFLMPGNYTVEIRSTDKKGGSFDYVLRGLVRSDPIGPYTVDTAGDPGGGLTAPPEDDGTVLFFQAFSSFLFDLPPWV